MVQWPTTTTQTESSTNFIYPQPITVTAKVTTPGKAPTITGQFAFSGANALVTGTPATDANGNQVLTATATYVPTSSGDVAVVYLGDANYARSQSSDFITVTVPDFSITPNQSSFTITVGQQMSARYTFTPLTNYSSTVAVGCNVGGANGGVVGLTCALSANSLVLANSTPQSVVVTISTPTSSAPVRAVVTKKKTTLFPIYSDWPLYGGGIAAMMALTVLMWPGRVKRYRLASALGAASIIVASIGCGGGSGSLASTGSTGGTTGTGGGVSTPESTSVTLSLPVKAAYGTAVQATATVSSAKPVTGGINFIDANSGSLGYVNVNPASASQSVQLLIPAVGFYNITAQYSGDASNLPSKSPPVAMTITGTGGFGVAGATGPLYNAIPVSVTVQ
jgi:hypothetical protein